MGAIASKFVIASVIDAVFVNYDESSNWRLRERDVTLKSLPAGQGKSPPAMGPMELATEKMNW